MAKSKAVLLCYIVHRRFCWRRRHLESKWTLHLLLDNKGQIFAQADVPGSGIKSEVDEGSLCEEWGSKSFDASNRMRVGRSGLATSLKIDQRCFL